MRGAGSRPPWAGVDCIAGHLCPGSARLLAARAVRRFLLTLLTALHSRAFATRRQCQIIFGPEALSVRSSGLLADRFSDVLPNQATSLFVNEDLFLDLLRPQLHHRTPLSQS